jgi:dynein regulatory complex protein 1
LVEQKLLSLLEPLDTNDQSMIKVDSIFKALNVETEDDVKLLAQYFINHRQYLELIKRKSFIQTDKRGVSFKESGAGPNESRHDNDDASIIVGMNQMQFDDETPVIAHSESGSSEKIIPTDKISLIHPNEVLKALKTFVTIHHKSKK